MTSTVVGFYGISFNREIMISNSSSSIMTSKIFSSQISIMFLYRDLGKKFLPIAQWLTLCYRQSGRRLLGESFLASRGAPLTLVAL
jgi:hypothetical protein